MNIIVIVNFEVKSESLNDFVDILEGVKRNLPSVKGCINVSVFQSVVTAYKFTLLETWQSKEQHQANLEELSKNGTWEKIERHLSRPPLSDYVSEL